MIHPAAGRPAGVVVMPALLSVDVRKLFRFASIYAPGRGELTSPAGVNTEGGSSMPRVERVYTAEERAAHRAFAEAHWPWALQVARRTYARNLDIQDRKSVAFEALMRAARAFNPNLGYSPTTYIAASVRSQILRESRANRLIHAPANVLEGRSRTDGHRARVAAAVRTARPLSLDRCDAGGLRLADIVAAPAERPVDPMVPSLSAAIERLPERLAWVVRGRLEGLTLREMAGELGVTHERVRQLHQQALGMLRKALDPKGEIA